MLVSSGLVVFAAVRSHAPVEHPVIERGRAASPPAATLTCDVVVSLGRRI
ncbi:MAG TPA: hypothetical protein VKE51_17155 [Vicinamibacterales bacterium]|nr:hypothetical protein [Vicinamibacterales bacterium]